MIERRIKKNNPVAVAYDVKHHPVMFNINAEFGNAVIIGRSSYSRKTLVEQLLGSALKTATPKALKLIWMDLENGVSSFFSNLNNDDVSMPFNNDQSIEIKFDKLAQELTKMSALVQSRLTQYAVDTRDALIDFDNGVFLKQPAAQIVIVINGFDKLIQLGKRYQYVLNDLNTILRLGKLVGVHVIYSVDMFRNVPLGLIGKCNIRFTDILANITELDAAQIKQPIIQKMRLANRGENKSFQVTWNEHLWSSEPIVVS